MLVGPDDLEFKFLEFEFKEFIGLNFVWLSPLATPLGVVICLIYFWAEMDAA